MRLEDPLADDDAEDEDDGGRVHVGVGERRGVGVGRRHQRGRDAARGRREAAGRRRLRRVAVGGQALLAKGLLLEKKTMNIRQ